METGVTSAMDRLRPALTALTAATLVAILVVLILLLRVTERVADEEEFQSRCLSQLGGGAMFGCPKPGE